MSIPTQHNRKTKTWLEIKDKTAWFEINKEATCLETKRDDTLTLRVYQQGNHTWGLPSEAEHEKRIDNYHNEDRNDCYNEDYCTDSDNLVITCNDSLLLYFLDHTNEDGFIFFYLLTVSNVILDCFSNCKLCFINKKKKVPTTMVID